MLYFRSDSQVWAAVSVSEFVKQIPFYGSLIQPDIADYDCWYEERLQLLFVLLELCHLIFKVACAGHVSLSFFEIMSSFAL